MRDVCSPSRRPRLRLLALLPLLIPVSCREAYREGADRESYHLLKAATRDTPWQVDGEFTLDADVRSRLHDPSDPDRPVLPAPGPDLYRYQIQLDSLEGASTRRGLALEDDSEAGSSKIQPIPGSYWEVLPPACLDRMFEFDSVLLEYRRLHGELPEGLDSEAAPRLSLRQTLEQARLNSREYQDQKERLYRAALALTLERYDYGLKFLTPSVGSDATYVIDESDGTRTESGSVDSSAQIDGLLLTGGTFLARFANQVVFTFDGPEGWSRDLSSELLFQIDQSLLQRDIQFDALIQAERNLVYAARDYARFRREFFLDIATRFYGILQNYRSIEIESQNYFSLVRTFEQAQAELRSGVTSAPNPVAVDQFEQGMLSGRSSLISAWNRLEQSLDSLKIEMGLPTELPLNVNLDELTELTDLDSAEVDAERVRRWLGRLEYLRTQSNLNRPEVLNATKYLVLRLLEWMEATGNSAGSLAELRELLARVLVEQARIQVENARQTWVETTEGDTRSPLVFSMGRLYDLLSASLELLESLVRLGKAIAVESRDWNDLEVRLESFREKIQTFSDRLPEAIQDPEGATLTQMRSGAIELEREMGELAASLAGELLEGEAAGDADRNQKALDLAEEAVSRSKQLIEGADLGLTTISIGVDEAMGTALVQRFDLMNERGRLADDLRRVKLAADDLATVLDLRATHRISSREDKPLKFSSRDSQTAFSLGIDLPVERKSQRNAYRNALLSYQAGRRSLQQLEDTVKFNIRDALRGLEETRTQYSINVRRAALAAEQVISIRLQLALGIQGVRGTDLLDALQDSRNALISVANARIGYIVDRAELAHDLEQLQLGEDGFWPHIVDATYQPIPDLEHPENAGEIYGSIPGYLLVSSELREQLVPVAVEEREWIDRQADRVEESGEEGAGESP